MRNVGGGVQGQERVYVPGVDGEPIRVIIRSPTEAGKRRFRSWLVEQRRAEVGKMSNEAIVSEPIRLCVVRVEEYTRDDINGPVPISTADDLLLYGETDVVDDVAAHILSLLALSAEQKKRQEKLPDSSSPAKQPSASVPSASPQDFAVPGVATTHEGQMASGL